MQHDSAALPITDDVRDCLAKYQADEQPERAVEKRAVKELLALLEAKVPGNSVEFRVPPYAATQVVEGGRHRRGTPRAGVEVNARTFIEVATGTRSWHDAVADGSLQASGERSDLSAAMPLLPITQETT